MRGPGLTQAAPGLAALRDLYLSHLLYRNRAEATIRGVRNIFRMFEGFLAARGVGSVHGIRAEDLEAYKRRLQGHRYRRASGEMCLVSKKYPVEHLIILKRFFMFLVAEDVLARSPMDGVKIPPVPDALPRGILTPGEMRRVLAGPDLGTPEGYRDRAILETFYATGIRSGELCRLKTCDIDFESGLLKILEGKGGKDRMVPVGRGAMRFLARYLREIRPVLLVRKGRGVKHRATDGTLFASDYGAKFMPNRLSVHLKKYIASAGLPEGKAPKITPHSFRHSVATHLLQNGMDVRYVQEFLGHTRIQTTQRYTRVNVEDVKRETRENRPRALNGGRPSVASFEGDGRVTYGPHASRA